MAVDIYQTGVSGLLAAQGQLATTGHNIANVNTEGFSRQRVEQMTTLQMYSGGQFYGTGTRVTDVTRMYQEYAFKDVLVNNTEKAGAESLYNQLSFLDKNLAGVNEGLASSLDDMYQAINAVVDNPGNLGNRDLMLANAKDITNHFNEYYSALEQEMNIKNRDIESRAEHVTSLTSGIAELNQQILNAGLNGSPNDLLDQRDRLIQELGQEVKITTIKGQDGMISVMLGGREPLVSGNQAYAMEVRPGSPDPQQTELYLSNPNNPDHATRVKGSQALGGEMGALFHYRDQILGPNLSDMGKVAVAIADAFNEVQKQGVDLNGEVGKNFFTDINAPEAQANRFLSNNPNVNGAVEITDTGKLTGGEYTLKYHGGDYMLTDITSGETFAIDAADVENTPPSTEQTINRPDLGFSITLSDVPDSNDEMQIRPTRQGGNDLKVELNTGDQIAASGAIMVDANKDNTGTAKVGVQVVEPTPPATAIDEADYPLTVKVEDDGAGGVKYVVTDKNGTLPALFDGQPTDGSITFGDVQMNIQGDAKEFDQFVIKQAKGSGNNTNALEFADLQNKKWLDNGKSTVTDSLNKTAVEIGGLTRNQRVKAEAAGAAYNQSYDRMLSTSGVNLDEEAANLLRYQQSYMASARVVTVASETMNTLLQIR
ncbi:flagellar hook-associated protein FlgK [Oceanisphaera pacifica]|uniref:Flagellar hook-associated protein 1 n=1 Tax=Oceanisphaera pacifica TaxID=2818389 RepID=A0ABS3NH94_9GAMM|nr:flagellar hook-associated protein FlgK [Oceanisphaera pacifica]MBO1519959.1 flagellar hook-associated protein FlgK [Oceanisphaera pacifica]